MGITKILRKPSLQNGVVAECPKLSFIDVMKNIQQAIHYKRQMFVVKLPARDLFSLFTLGVKNENLSA